MVGVVGEDLLLALAPSFSIQGPRPLWLVLGPQRWLERMLRLQSKRPILKSLDHNAFATNGLCKTIKRTHEYTVCPLSRKLSGPRPHRWGRCLWAIRLESSRCYSFFEILWALPELYKIPAVPVRIRYCNTSPMIGWWSFMNLVPLVKCEQVLGCQEVIAEEVVVRCSQESPTDPPQSIG